MTDKAQELYKRKKNLKYAVEKKLDEFAMWSFILAVAPFLSLFMVFVPVVNVLFAFLLVPSPILGIIFGVVGLSRIEMDERMLYGRGFAVAGIVISVLQICLGVLAVLFFVFGISMLANF